MDDYLSPTENIRYLNPLTSFAPFLLILIIVIVLNFQLIFLSGRGWFSSVPEEYRKMLALEWIFEIYILFIILFTGLGNQFKSLTYPVVAITLLLILINTFKSFIR